MKELKEIIEHKLPGWNQNLMRMEFVAVVNENGLQKAENYGAEVATKAAEALRYWENHALPGKQV